MFSQDEIAILDLKQIRTRLYASAKCLLAFGLLSVCLCPSAMGQAATQGQWATLPYSMPINPVHMALMNYGKVLIVSVSANLPSNTSLAAAVLDPRDGTNTP